MYDPMPRGRSMLGLWRRRFDFLLRRWARLLFGGGFRSGRGLTTGGRYWSRLGWGDF